MSLDTCVLPARQRGPHPVPSEIAHWCELEERYLEGRYDGAGGPDGVALTAGIRRVLVCAGHAVTHVRDGARKPADIATGGLADLLAAAAGAWSLTSTGLPGADPNYDPPGTFKHHLFGVLDHVDVVLDLHGMRDEYGPDVCLGRGAHPHLADPVVGAVEQHLRAAGFSVTVDDPFLADGDHTITTVAQRAGTAAVQIELARRVRNPWDAPGAGARLVAALTSAIADLDRGTVRD